MIGHDFLVELGTEELPPKMLQQLAKAFEDNIQGLLSAKQIAFTGIQSFAAPRRLAVLIENLNEAQQEQLIERKGPAIVAAFDKEGNPTKAAQGFAKSCNTDVSELEIFEEGKGKWLFYRSLTPGQKTAELLPAIVSQSLANLPINKAMRWGKQLTEFIRPVHWLLMLYGKEVIDCSILGLKSGNLSWGHRFHHNNPILIVEPKVYQEALRQAFVICDFQERKTLIKKQLQDCAAKLQAEVVIDDDLLDEVTALNEWPVALSGSFAKSYLQLPAEALITTMKENQKYFHLLDSKKQLLPHFITVANIESKDSQQIIQGNEKVIGPRLADAKFFFDQDRKISLKARSEQLKTISFQHKLGDLYSKTERMGALACAMANKLGLDSVQTLTVANLCKADLNTEMVLEFPNLQGIMGQYYAGYEGFDETVAQAILDHYKPRFTADKLPRSQVASLVALADRLDTLVGIFAIGLVPSGNKDPFALRRAAFGIARILIEQQLDLDLRELLVQAMEQYEQQLPELGVIGKKDQLVEQILQFIFERLRSYYESKQVRAEIFLSVLALKPTNLSNFDKRIQAVADFYQLPEAISLAAVNKRVGNILAKAKNAAFAYEINSSLLQETAEIGLAQAVMSAEKEAKALTGQQDYTAILSSLAQLKEPVDTFFDQVMVNVDNPELRNNRLNLLQHLRNLFLQVADISLLSSR